MKIYLAGPMRVPVHSVNNLWSFGMEAGLALQPGGTRQIGQKW